MECVRERRDTGIMSHEAKHTNQIEYTQIMRIHQSFGEKIPLTCLLMKSYLDPDSLFFSFLFLRTFVSNSKNTKKEVSDTLIEEG